MSFPPATEMVQFAGFASSSYGFTEGYPLGGGLPHSEIRGSTGARPSPRLFAACHVLHRLSVPRHPPDALLKSSPTPSPKHAAAAKLRQRTDDRRQMTETTRARPTGRACLPLHRRRYLTVAAGAEAWLFAPPGRPAPASLHTHAQARHATDPAAGRRASRLLHGHDSLHDVIRSEVGEQRSDPAIDRRSPSQNSRSPCQKTWTCVHAWWWAWADLNGRPHAYQACALTS